jgi:hypothetical protein
MVQYIIDYVRIRYPKSSQAFVHNDEHVSLAIWRESL